MSRMMSDRKADMGSGRKGSVFPEQVSVKEMKSGEGVGKMGDYPDKEQDIKREQDGAVGKVKGHPMKPGYRQ